MNSVTGAECSAAQEGGSFKADGQYTKLLRTLFPSAHSTVNNSFMLSLSYGNWSAVFRQLIYPEKTHILMLYLLRFSAYLYLKYLVITFCLNEG